MTSNSNIPEEIQDKIDRYLLDRMDLEERNSFEKEIRNTPGLSEWVEDQRDLQMAIQAGAFRDKLREIHHQEISRSASTFNFRFAGIAATAFILLAVAAWFIIKPPKNEVLFSEFVTVEPGLPTPMSASSQYNFYDAMVDFKAEKYETALQKWMSIQKDSPENDTLQYFIASAHFNLSDFDAAKQGFLNVAQSPSVFKEKAEWYFVLSCLKTDDEKQIHLIADTSNSAFAEKIGEISNRLKNN